MQIAEDHQWFASNKSTIESLQAKRSRKRLRIQTMQTNFNPLTTEQAGLLANNHKFSSKTLEMINKIRIKLKSYD